MISITDNTSIKPDYKGILIDKLLSIDINKWVKTYIDDPKFNNYYFSLELYDGSSHYYFNIYKNRTQAKQINSEPIIEYKLVLEKSYGNKVLKINNNNTSISNYSKIKKLFDTIDSFYTEQETNAEDEIIKEVLSEFFKEV